MTTQDSTYGSSEVHGDPAHGDPAHGDTAHDAEHPESSRHAGEHTGAYAGEPSPVIDDDGPTLLPVDSAGDVRTADDADGVSGSGRVGDPDARDEAPATAPTTPGAVAAPIADDAPAATTTVVETDEVAAGPAVVTARDATPASTATASPGATTDTTGAASEEWHELQSRFVDDPTDAVRQAGELVERALADLRTHLESGTTEDLRTAFRRYRELHSSLT